MSPIVSSETKDATASAALAAKQGSLGLAGFFSEYPFS